MQATEVLNANGNINDAWEECRTRTCLPWNFTEATREEKIGDWKIAYMFKDCSSLTFEVYDGAAHEVKVL